ncbi:energy transducer TonB [Pseudorhodoferax sp.]|uniref:energy transducer TonB n=1 Tax=Pseudorhodoferax sp. TaxID=1993553 RepID=UPI0039E6C63F
MASSTYPPPSGLSRNTVIVGSVIALHAAALWALQNGLLQRAVEVIVPVEILSQFVEPPRPTPPPPPPVPAPPQQQVKKPEVRPKPPKLPPAPQPMAIKDPTPAPAAPVGVVEPPAPLPPIEQPVAPAPPAPPPPAPPAPPQIQMPSSSASYLQNPSPVYPAISRRLGEQGKVIVRVLIGTNGQPERAEVKRSSGFERLDRAALDYVMKCRYVPGKVNGVVQAMWYEAPVNYVLE